MRAAGLLRVAALAVIWGSGFLWIKIGLRGFTPVQVTWARLALGALVLAVLLMRAGTVLPRGRALWGHLTMAALLGNAVPYLLFGVAEQTVASNLAGAINATTPIWTLAFALAARTERRVTPLRMVGLGLGLAGGVVIFEPWRADGGSGVLGAVLCLLASMSYGAGYVYIGRFLSGTGLTPTVLSMAQLTAATGWLTLALPAGGFAAPQWRADAVVSVLVLGAIGTGVAYVLNYRIIADDGPVLASTVTYLLPVVAVVLGALVLDEPLTPTMVAGVVIVLLGVALSRRSPAVRYARSGGSTTATR
jgi:drug/metabolite transporter (DMT)-like permease